MDAAMIKLPDFGSAIAIPETWLAKQKRSLEWAGKIQKVVDPVSYDNASEALSMITKCSGELEKERKKFTAPFTKVSKAIKAMCDRQRQSLEVEKKRLKGLCAEYAEAQARKAAEERRAAEEAARKEAEKQFAEQQAADELGLDAPAKPIEVETAPAPEVEEAHSSSSRVTRRLVWRLEDEEAVPRAFLQLDSRKVNEYMKMQKGALMDGLEKGSDGRQYVAGIRFEIKTDVSGR